MRILYGPQHEPPENSIEPAKYILEIYLIHLQIIQSHIGHYLPVYINVYRFITIPRAFDRNEDTLDPLRFLIERERETLF